MKQERLLALLIHLCRKGKTTAPELAARFEVSRRTVNRDLESLCQAGVPLITEQGKGGGVSLPENYTMEGALFPADEIDLNSFYKDSTLSKTALIRQAMGNKRDIAFTYYSSRGKMRKQIRPVKILYRWSAWYVQGWCRERREYRLYKFNRLWQLVLTEGNHPDPPPAPRKEEFPFPENFRLKARFREEAAHRLVEEYGPGSVKKKEKGIILFERPFTNYDYMLTWILGFGDLAEVIEPVQLREDIRKITASLQKIYD
ncbi:MAG: WYL domain-containing protein [Spirochaetales bacterium]|nr:WYL domain-containing protein [Spirochaetales bacterium]